ncbi:hypothetical protein [Nocardia brasiliensis]|uniref:hypothetical protein n=1 Tax=Nocardia brasiliensis TaxID=37326 RepID=UPI0011DCCED5|nr:hypothetical protein [Nocardia brasiliensis]
MRSARAAWLVLAGATAAWGVFVASEPLYQISSCEVIGLDPACGDPMVAHYGARLVLLLAVPVVLCAVPALRAGRGLSWLIAGILLIGPLIALPTTDSVFAAWGYYLPVGAVGVVVAWFSNWYERRKHAERVAGPRQRRSNASAASRQART